MRIVQEARKMAQHWIVHPLSKVIAKVFWWGRTVEPVLDSSKGEIAKVCINGSEYSFFKPLGQGFYGSVQQVACLDQDNLGAGKAIPSTNMFAMKMIPRREVASEENLKEVAIMRELGECQHIVGALGVSNDDEYDYLLMPSSGGNLASLTQGSDSSGVYINTRKRLKALNFMDKILEKIKPRDSGFHALDEEMARTIYAGVLSGIDYMHNKGIVHRDIKPSNVLVDPQGKGRLADFGAAAYLSEEPKDGGDGRFSAPERSGATGSYTKASDIWMIGACMLATVMPTAMLYTRGNKPHSTEEIRSNIMRASISDDLKDLLLSMLQEDPTLRPSAEVLLKHPFFLQQPDAESPKANGV